MIVLVCGGRDFEDKELVFSVLDKIRPTFLVEGGAKGADTLAYLWAKKNLSHENRVTVEAEWGKYGKAAGYKRNQKMLDDFKPHLVVAFPGGSGTADMVRRAKRAGVEVREIEG